MVAISRIIFFALGASAANVGIRASCGPKEQQLINGKCCQGVALADSNGGTDCCVQSADNPFVITSNMKCIARINEDDPDYDTKYKDAISGASSSTSSSSPSSTPTASGTSSDSSASSSPTSDSDSGSSDSKTNGAFEGNRATLGMVVALAAVPVVFYGL
ncbi:uncharacterized protein F4822DRAFT_430074 [Hypoxylon trugodes]|uniref:uncharacterized protein n=1 Tax=Hypoxylon trugodes TaxID=326681 RepID=UPI002192F65B|nr:uncharacterized protein F4822DRAFT_430074 [Hypoxylon trugodes]KAI1387318.1 hypothetical protein F4822DRAFT_430074 [Hypoxylon trugodes]